MRRLLNRKDRFTESAMKLQGIRANVVMGATGAGKTSFILQLLAGKPPGERWAVLVNDVGRSTIGNVTVGSRELVVRDVAGCICCTAQVALRTALVALMRETRPQRLLVEASAAAEPEAVLSVLRERGIATAITLGPTVTIFARHHLADPRYARSTAYGKQLLSGDFVLTRAAGEAQLAAARTELVGHGFAIKRVESADTFRIERLNASPGAADGRA